MRYFSNTLFFLLFLNIFSILDAQNSSNTDYQISGIVTNEKGDQPLQYATISLLLANDSTPVNGTISDAEGKFSLNSGSGDFFIKTSFLGYEAVISEPISLGPSNKNVQLPPIKLTAKATTLDEVEIAGEKGLVELSIDKKIYNVGKDLANVGANASEILGNIPSVSVDGEGSVKLRGSSDIRILIDGKPSALASAEGLRQLQGSQIEKVEVITNPSAKYEAEGNGGIINIVLKKQVKKGFNGSFEILVGDPTNLGASANINYRVKKFNFFVNYGLSYRIEPNRSSTYQEIYAKDTTFIQNQFSNGTKEGWNNTIQGGLDYYFNDNNILTASYRFRRSDAQRLTYLTYEDYLFNDNNLISTTLRDQDEMESEPYSEYVVSYKKLFTKKGQEFNATFQYLNYWENSDQTYTEVSFKPGETAEENPLAIQRAVNDEYENQYLIQVDYTQPIGKEGKLEAGIRSSLRDMTNDFLVTEQNSSGEWTVFDGFDNIFVYNENIHAVYGILGNKGKKLSYQVGLRAEATDVKTVLEETNEENPRKYNNLFPSAHLSYHFPGDNDLQISYSRRVRRPVYWDLSPFVTLSDGRNFFSGNPDLNPSFTHSIEIGHLKYFEKGSLSSALYYRNSTQTIARIRTLDSEGNGSTIPQNLNGQHAFGAEMAIGYNLYSWWKIDANFNFFRAITDGTNIDPDFESDTYSWFARQTSKFTLKKQFSIQLRGVYEAAEITPQGERRPFYSVDITLKKDFWKRKGSLTLNAVDIFKSRTRRSIFEGINTEGEAFFSDRSSQRQWRQITLAFSYRFNQ